MLIRYSRDAEKTLQRMPANAAKLIRSKIKQYAADPESLANNVKRLQGRPEYRLRVGNYRVIFTQDGVVMAIIAIGARGGIYKE